MCTHHAYTWKVEKTPSFSRSLPAPALPPSAQRRLQNDVLQLELSLSLSSRKQSDRQTHFVHLYTYAHLADLFYHKCLHILHPVSFTHHAAWKMMSSKAGTTRSSDPTAHLRWNTMIPGIARGGSKRGSQATNAPRWRSLHCCLERLVLCCCRRLRQFCMPMSTDDRQSGMHSFAH